MSCEQDTEGRHKNNKNKSPRFPPMTAPASPTSKGQLNLQVDAIIKVFLSWRHAGHQEYQCVCISRPIFHALTNTGLNFVRLW
jgi:hypothetical protein